MARGKCAAPGVPPSLSTLTQPLSNPRCDNPGMKINKRHQISRKPGILGTCRRLLLLAVRRVKEEEDWRYSQEERPRTLTAPGSSSACWNGSTHPVHSPRRPTPGDLLFTGRTRQRRSKAASNLGFWPGEGGQYPEGKLELKGGSKEDRLAAHEWISMFCHEAVEREGSDRQV
jgi:hypothetical protein